MANNAKLTLHLRVLDGLERAPHHRGLLQGLRASAAPGGLRRRRPSPASRRPRGCCDAPERDPDRGRRLRDGQPALGREGARANGRRARRHERSRPRSAPPTASCCPASAPSRRRCDNLRRLGLDELLKQRARAGRARCSASASACSCCSRPRARTRASEGLGLLEGRVERLPAPGPEGAADRLEPRALGEVVAPHRAASRPNARSTSCTRSRRWAFATRTGSAAPSTASRSSARSSAAPSTGSSSTPRSRARPG